MSILEDTILQLEAKNTNSYPGEPTANIHTDLDMTNWSFGGVTNSDNGTTLFGQTVYKILPNTSTAYHRSYKLQGALLSLSTDYTLSMYVKANGYNYMSFGMTDSSYYQTQTMFNLTNGSVEYDYTTNGGSISDSGSQYVGDGWYRCWLTISLSEYVSNNYFLVFVHGTALNPPWTSWTPNGTSSILATSPQIEQKSYVTQFTTGTRSASTGWKDISGQGNNVDITTMVYEKNQMVFDGTNNRPTFSSNFDSGATERTWMFWVKFNAWSVSGTPYYQIYIQESCVWIGQYNNNLGIDLSDGSWFDGSGGTNTGAVVGTGGLSLDTWYHVCFSWDGTNVRGYLNGILKSTTATTGVSTLGAGTTPRQIGSRANSLYTFDGLIDKATIINRSISTFELENIYAKEQPQYNTALVEGVYFPYSKPSPLLYEFNCLTDKSLKGEETENVCSWGTDIYGSGGSPARCTLSGDTIPSPIGNTPLKMIATGADPYISTYNTTAWTLAPASSGQTWTWSVWAKAEVSGTQMQMFCFGANSSGAYIDYISNSWNLTTEWVRYSKTHTFSDGNVVGVQVRLDGPNTYTVNKTLWFDGLQIEQKSYATPFTPKYRNKWQSIRNLADRSQRGSFHTAGTGDYPTINTSDHNGLVMASTDATNGNFVTLSKPELVTSGMVLHLDAGDGNSYPGTGTTWTDLAKGNDFTNAGGLAYDSWGLWTLTSGGLGMYRTSAATTNSTCTLVIWMKTTEVQALFFEGQTGSQYIGAYRSTNKEYYGDCGTPDFYMDTVDTSNIYDNIRDNDWHMVEFKNVDFSTWTWMGFNTYAGYDFGNGSVAQILIYNRNLTENESTQNYNATKGRFGY